MPSLPFKHDAVFTQWYSWYPQDIMNDVPTIPPFLMGLFCNCLFLVGLFCIKFVTRQKAPKEDFLSMVPKVCMVPIIIMAQYAAVHWKIHLFTGVWGTKGVWGKHFVEKKGNALRRKTNFCQSLVQFSVLSIFQYCQQVAKKKMAFARATVILGFLTIWFSRKYQSWMVLFGSLLDQFVSRFDRANELSILQFD